MWPVQWRLYILSNWTEKHRNISRWYFGHSRKCIRTYTHDTHRLFSCFHYYCSVNGSNKKKERKGFFFTNTSVDRKKCNKNYKEYWILYFSLSSRITRLMTFRKRLWNADNEKFPASRKIIIHRVPRARARKWNFRFVTHISRRAKYRTAYFRWRATRLAIKLRV